MKEQRAKNSLFSPIFYPNHSFLKFFVYKSANLKKFYGLLLLRAGTKEKKEIFWFEEKF
ncbi:MAG: hypothetical protein N3D78_00420 [Candidatus Aenigmarchaeota archaeon]|nr:hypothetical protein [Candidatus Aenigmarchaeota archaeon]